MSYDAIANLDAALVKTYSMLWLSAFLILVACLVNGPGGPMGKGK